MSFNEIFPNYPKGWRSLTLGELAKECGGSIQTGPFGSQLHASDYVDCGIPSIMPKNISVDGVLKNDIAQIKPEDAERLTKYRVRLGDIVYSRRGDVEKCCLITETEDGWLCGTGCLRVRIPADNFLQQYVHAYLCHPAVRSWIVRHAIGATMPNLNTSILAALPVLIPGAKEIQRIVEIWSTVSKKITLNTQINQTLEQMAQALFKSWFVDFDLVIDNALEAGNPIPEPLSERAARRQVVWAADNESAPARLPAETRRLFPDSFEEDKKLGWVPTGWKVCIFADIANNIRNGIGPDKIDEKDHYVGLEHIDRISLSLQRWGDAGEVSSNKTKFEENDVLFGKLRPYFHKVCIAPFEGICSTDILVLRAKEENLRAYVSLQAFEAEFVEYANLRSTGTRMPRASWKDISQYELVIPEDKVLNHFEKVVGGMLAPLSNNIFETKTLAQLRDTLLPKLLSGELQLPEAEAAVETTLEVETV